MLTEVMRDPMTWTCDDVEWTGRSGRWAQTYCKRWPLYFPLRKIQYEPHIAKSSSAPSLSLSLLSDSERVKEWEPWIWQSASKILPFPSVTLTLGLSLPLRFHSLSNSLVSAYLQRHLRLHLRLPKLLSNFLPEIQFEDNQSNALSLKLQKPRLVF